MRSRALMPLAVGVSGELRYACQVLPPAPAVVANCWQCASAPASPPRSPPFPSEALVTKKLMLGACGTCCACAVPLRPNGSSAVNASMDEPIILCMVNLPLYGYRLGMMGWAHRPHL